MKQFHLCVTPLSLIRRCNLLRFQDMCNLLYSQEEREHGLSRLRYSTRIVGFLLLLIQYRLTHS